MKKLRKKSPFTSLRTTTRTNFLTVHHIIIGKLNSTDKGELYKIEDLKKLFAVNIKKNVSFFAQTLLMMLVDGLWMFKNKITKCKTSRSFWRSLSRTHKMVLYEKFEPFTHRSPFAFESQLDNFCLSSGDFFTLMRKISIWNYYFYIPIWLKSLNCCHN